MVNYTTGSNKGQTQQGDVLNNPFYLGTRRDGVQVPFDSDYTSSKVVETASTTSLVLSWTPVVKGTFTYNDTQYDVKVTHADGTVTYKNVESDGKTVTGVVSGDRVAYV